MEEEEKGLPTPLRILVEGGRGSSAELAQISMRESLTGPIQNDIGGWGAPGETAGWRSSQSRLNR